MTAEAQARILLVDDEPQILRALTPALVTEGYAVATAASGEAALRQMADDPCDLVVLDLGLPDLDGKEVISHLRTWCDAPVIVLSARHLESEKIDALDRGANDFVNKPVGMGELMARIRVGLRSQHRDSPGAARLVLGEVTIDFAARRISIEGDEVKLTPREYELLRTLARRAGQPVTHREIIAAVWGSKAEVDAQFVRVLVSQVRQKLEADPSCPRVLLTEPGIGYRLREE